MYQHVRLVKSQIAWLQRQANRYPPDHPKYRPEQIALYGRLVAEHEELLRFLEGLTVDPSRPNGRDSDDPAAQTKAGDLSDLPPELLAELSDRATKGPTDPLVQLIKDRGGVATIDELLIDLYRKHGQIGKRVLIQNKLYRLSKQEAVWPMPGRKGVYTTKPPEIPGPEA